MRLALLYLVSTAAAAQALPDANSPGVSPTVIIGAGLVILLIIGGVIGFRAWRTHHLAAATAVSTAVAQAGDAVSTGTSYLATEISKLRAHLVSTAPAPTPLTPTEPTPAAPAGKNGQAGVFTITVTGDPKVDQPAISAAYFS